MKRATLVAMAVLCAPPANAQDASLVMTHTQLQRFTSVSAVAPNKSGTNSNGVASMSPGITNKASSPTNWHELHTLSGSRTIPAIGHEIEINDGQRGPPSSAGASTASSASYALSLVAKRPNWNDSNITGEMDGLNIFLRQANGDTAGFVSNVGVRSGFAAVGEGVTYSIDAKGAVVRGVNIQLGVVNPRDGGEYGFIANAANGRGLASAFRASNRDSATWTDFFTALNSSGTVLARIDGSGAFVGAAIVAGGTTPTNNTGSCTNVGAAIGGNTAGAFSTTASCSSKTTVKLVFSYTSAHGWVCIFQNQTTAISFRQTAYTPTSCTVTLGGMTGKADSIVYSATAF